MRLWPFTAANAADDASTTKASSWASYLTLPNLPSLPNISLPSFEKLQQSLFRYIINRTLGQYLDLDAAHDGSQGRLEADFANGQVRLTQVKLKVDVRTRHNSAMRSRLSGICRRSTRPYRRQLLLSSIL